MRIFKLLFVLFIFSSCVAKTKQDSFLKHNVEKGETIFSIAKKYQITPFDIYRLNPDAKNGIQENTVLLIPKRTVKETKAEAETKNIVHEVKSKETLYSIAKEYEVTVAQIQEWNSELLKDGLKKGQEIIVGKEKSAVSENYVEVQNTKNTVETFSHKVLPKETLYGIATKYNISIDEIIAQNPDSKDGLKEGTILTLKKASSKTITQVNDAKLYTVKPKQTLYSLSKELKLSQKELIKLNPELEEGLKEGMVLKLPNDSKQDSLFIEKPLVNLLSTIKKDKKRNLVLLLPFNLSKIDENTASIRQQIKDTPLLNLTLDFYAGAMMAIDSAKVLGLPVNVKILNVESTRTSSNIAQLIKDNDFSNVDAVIGPFQNSHAETTAELLLKYNTPVISPLSKEVGMKLPNLYNAVPSEEYMISKLFAYFKEKEGNVVSVISAKKKSTKDFLIKNYPEVKHTAFNESGAVDLNNLKALLVKGKKNFVIIESQTTNQILNTTNFLMKIKGDYDVQLVVFKLNDSFEYIDIPIANLTELNMLFPSTKNEEELEADKIFDKKYRNENGISPSVPASKGFDITFDTILRICQEEGFAKSVENYKTEYFENSFDYINDNGNIINNGVYLMYYDTDLTIKQVK
ncbi:hypothetical protein SY27_01395 [Flavobacterium sp. 316]|uniref:LysM peptidoglycan-binding domain-containing protein n=1 Tax=Flavobacterium sediminilitoris TaxID=2024526 RepID=A0ABY4HIX4_9FLAO|nr:MULTISPECIES: LysM peptidoglycan-binding domain-containing protein [Flavobacterium]KIX22522.1 hypothetical protein SY27_01395 [Flavobacterium sp. 316]UOX32786.1 LysM peptidoglycan-binding domain-containing protein [Flavobacterium sediminilitoris]